jgi:hypothetical protein
VLAGCCLAVGGLIVLGEDAGVYVNDDLGSQRLVHPIGSEAGCGRAEEPPHQF